MMYVVFGCCNGLIITAVTGWGLSEWRYWVLSAWTCVMFVAGENVAMAASRRQLRGPD